MFPSWRQALVIFFSAMVLAVATCGGMLANFQLEGNSKETPFLLFTIGFAASLLGVFVGFVMIIYRFVQDRRNRPKP